MALGTENVDVIQDGLARIVLHVQPLPQHSGDTTAGTRIGERLRRHLVRLRGTNSEP